MKNQKFWINLGILKILILMGLQVWAFNPQLHTTAELLHAKHVAINRIQILNDYNKIIYGIPKNDLRDLKSQRAILRKLYLSHQNLKSILTRETSNSNLSEQCILFAKATKKASSQFYFSSYKVINHGSKNNIDYHFFRHLFELNYFQVQSLFSIFELELEGGNSPILNEKADCNWQNRDLIKIQFQEFNRIASNLKTNLIGEAPLDQIMNSLKEYSKAAVSQYEYEKKILIPKLIISSAAGLVGLSVIKNYPYVKMALKSGVGFYFGLKASDWFHFKHNKTSHIEQITELVDWSEKIRIESSLALIEVISKLKTHEFEIKLEMIQKTRQEFTFLDFSNSLQQQLSLQSRLNEINFEINNRKSF